MIARGHQDQLRGLAATDALTGLVNHRGFHEALAEALSHARHATSRSTLVILDLDNFKAINDTHGHPYGDEVLRGVGRKLRSVVRGADTAARVGGEEFALILPDTPAERAIRSPSARGRQSQASPCTASSSPAPPAWPHYPADADDGATLCQLADGALYWAKRSGKRRTRRFDPEHVHPDWTTAARGSSRCSEPGRDHRRFQPVVALATGRFVGYEALARFPSSPDRAPEACSRRPTAAVSAPRSRRRRFGPRWLRGTAARDPSGAQHQPLAAHRQRAAGGAPGRSLRIVIEMTEHESSATTMIAAAISDLRSRGARIAIDDAGAGYAGLSR